MVVKISQEKHYNIKTYSKKMKPITGGNLKGRFNLNDSLHYRLTIMKTETAIQALTKIAQSKGIVNDATKQRIMPTITKLRYLKKDYDYKYRQYNHIQLQMNMIIEDVFQMTDHLEKTKHIKF